MFKNLTNRYEDPGFSGAVVVTNKSQHWLTVTDVGHRIPPLSHAAIHSSLVASSNLISEHVEAGLLVVSAQEPTNIQTKSKRKKKQDAVEPAKPVDESPEQPQIVEELISDTLVAEPEQDNWVSSNENIVGLPTTDDI